MRSEAVPIIRLNIDHMKHQIASMLGIEGSDLEVAINDQIEKQLAVLVQSEVPKLVRETILDCVTKSVKDYFSYGEGAKAIQDAVKKNFKMS